jgi:hypothetical protein
MFNQLLDNDASWLMETYDSTLQQVMVQNRNHILTANEFLYTGYFVVG